MKDISQSFFKHLFVFCCLHFIICSNNLYANGLMDEDQFKKDILQLQDFIIIDFSKANEKIQKLEEKHRNAKNPRLTYLFCLTKIRFNSSYGNYARVQFEINKARKLLFHFDPTNQEKLYLELFGAMYENADPNLDSIIKAAKKVINQAEKSNFYILIQAHIALAKAYCEQHKMDLSYVHLEAAQKIADVFGNDVFSYFVSNAAAQIYFFDNQFQKSLDTYQNLKILAQKKNWKYVEQYLNLSIGEVYLCTDRLDEAKAYFDIVMRNEASTELRDLYQVFGSLNYYFRLKGNIDSSYYYTVRQNNVDDHLEDLKNQSLIEELEKDFQKETDQFLLSKEKRKNQELRLIILIIIVSIVILVVVSFLFLRQKNESNRLLKKQKEEIDEKNRQITSALNLKENMIKEIHHRIKNNLQIISSIMNLQARNITDSDALHILEEVKDRVQAIAIVHNQLHLVQDSAFVHLETYLQQLSDQMSQSFSGYGKQIHVRVEVEDVDLDIDKAIPIGLIMCELVSNAFKHAFQNQQKGNVFVGFKRMNSENKCYELQVTDDGSGYHGEKDFLTQDSTGMEIVYAFIQQLDATYRVENSEKGLGVYVQFKIPEERINS